MEKSIGKPLHLEVEKHVQVSGGENSVGNGENYIEIKEIVLEFMEVVMNC